MSAASPGLLPEQSDRARPRRTADTPRGEMTLTPASLQLPTLRDDNPPHEMRKETPQTKFTQPMPPRFPTGARIMSHSRHLNAIAAF